MYLSLLWTDMLIWGLVVLLLVWGKYIASSPQVQQKWQLFFQSKIAMSSSIILSYYLIIALLDSIQINLGGGGRY